MLEKHYICICILKSSPYAVVYAHLMVRKAKM